MTLSIRPLRFTASIGANVARITDEETATALAPAQAVAPIIIDLGSRFSDGRAASWAAAIPELERAAAEATTGPTAPLAILGLAPIPMLVALGALVGDKVAGRVYERHRHRAEVSPDQAWVWEDDGPALDWEVVFPRRIQHGATNVAILLSVSGNVDGGAVAAALPNQHPQYEIRLKEPRTNVVRTATQLASFMPLWRQVLDHVREHYGTAVRVHVFAAVPVSIAIECGRRLLQVDPTLRIYNATGGAFKYALTVGPRGVSREPEATVVERADILVLVALQEEFKQLHELLPESVAIPDAEHGGCDYVCEVGDRQVVMRLVGAMGTGDAQLAADRSIARWRPRVAVWVGIAAGIHKDVRLGDVIVPDQIDGYDANLKAVNDAGGGYVYQERGEVFRADHALVQAVQNLPFAAKIIHDAWSQACGDELAAVIAVARKPPPKGSLREKPEIRVGHIASGNVVGAAKAFTARLRKRDASFIGLEMETAGLSRAAHKRATAVPVLALRGVSDFGDGRKSKFDGIGEGALRRVAMRNATRLLLALIESKIL